VKKHRGSGRGGVRGGDGTMIEVVLNDRLGKKVARQVQRGRHHRRPEEAGGRADWYPARQDPHPEVVQRLQGPHRAGKTPRSRTAWASSSTTIEHPLKGSSATEESCAWGAGPEAFVTRFVTAVGDTWA